MAEEKQPRSKTMQAIVLGRLRDGLMEGALLPGQVISIRKFAAMFGTSPMPVRDALSQLVAANALEEMPNRSVCVPVLSRDRIKEIFTVRAILESRAARQACERATPEFIEGLDAFNEDIDQENLRRNESKYALLRRNRNFHFTLYGASENEVLLPLIESLWLQCGPTLFLTLETANAPAAHDAHLTIIKGLRAGNADMVCDALEREIRATGATLLDHYDELMSEGPMSFVTGRADLGSVADFRAG